ncbi:MAG: M20/M25/M40 family metallo-hydrolase [Acidobacteria bacterium]|nr:M20/M25/M40 family metallo-hydrolase [Acidobacteriota bacterium]
MTTLSLLSDLVSVNSINPSLVPGAPGEAAVAEVAAQALKAGGLEVVFQEAAPGRPNVIGVLEGREAGPAVMLCGHLDTVGVEGMTNPFTPRVADGRLYGRGAQDMKGGVAAMIAAAVELARDWRRGRLIVACVADEEYESAGADALVKEWTADAAIVTEPTDLAMAVGHKGFAWIEVVTTGRAAHGSRPLEGRDAIVDMARVLMALEATDQQLQAQLPSEHQGTPSLHASIITGGRELSVYPDRCVLQFERRTVSGEDDGVVVGEVQAILARLRTADPAFRGEVRLMTSRPPYRLSPAAPLPVALAASLQARGLSSAPIGMSFWTDAAILAGAGIPSVLFGPGGAGLHSIEEYVTLADVDVCRDVLIETVRRLNRNTTRT